MKTTTRALFATMLGHIAAANGITADLVEKKFNVAPQPEQKLEAAIKASSEFLSQINIIPVTNQSGQALGVGAGGTLASRTDTSGGTRRQARQMGNPTERDDYFCKQTNYDWAKRYELIDAWAHKPEFELLLRQDIVDQQALDRILIGFNGTSAAANTDRDANPLLQDVNIGWLAKLRTKAAAQVMSQGFDAGGVYVKAGVELYDEEADNSASAKADYSSIDALALDAKRGIHERHRGDTDLVVIVGHDLVDDKYFNIAQTTGDTATEVEATDRILKSSKAIGGMPAYRVSGFPAGAILITKLSNLSIYYQEGTRRRRMVDEPDYDQVANYESVNEAFVIEEFKLAVLVENIVMGEKA